MPKLPENNIDKLFQQGTEHQEFQYREDAWAAMDSMLDARDRKKAMIWWYLALGLLVILAFITWLILAKQHGLVESTPDQDSTEEIIVNTNIDELGHVTSTLAEEIINSNNTNTNKYNTRLETELNKTKSFTPLVNTVSSEISKTNTWNTQNNKTLRVNNNDNLSQITTLGSHVEMNKKLQTSTNNEMLPHRSALSISSIERLNQNVISFNQAIIESPLSISQIVPSTVDTDLALMDRLHIGAFMGPEWSVLRRNSSPMLGQRIGAFISLDISQRWYASIGMAYSRKIFNGAGADFAAQNLFIDVVPEKMKGKSNFIEFPISVGYIFAQSNQSNWAIELGMTNFNHRSEWYGFEYTPDQMKPGLLMEVPSQEVNKMILGSGRIATRYQRLMPNGSAFHISPYVQIPLRGIGMGELSIFNTGIEIAYRFK